MFTDAQFDAWHAGLPPAQKAVVDRLVVTSRATAYSLFPIPEGPPDRAICTHEGGHAAAMHAFGIPIQFAFAKDSHGAVQPDVERMARPSNYVAFGVVMLAGDMAAHDRPPLSRAEWLARIAGERPDETSDERKAILFATELAQSQDALPTIERFWNIAVDMFASPGFWPAVYAVSDILRHDGRIEGDEVHRLCDQHLPFGSLVHLTTKDTTP